MVHLWYHVPYLFKVAGSSGDKHNSRMAVWNVDWYLFTGLFLCWRTGLVDVHHWVTIGCTESHLISKGSVWFWSSTVTSGEAGPQALCVPWFLCPSQLQWAAGTWHQHYFSPAPEQSTCSADNILQRSHPPHPTPSSTLTVVSPTGARATAHSNPTLMRGDRTGRFTRPLQWRRGLCQSSMQTAGGQGRRRGEWRAQTAIRENEWS